MLTRRELLTKGTTLLLLVPIVGCANSGGGGTPVCDPGSLAYKSSTDAEHTHVLCMATADLTNPPVEGRTVTTSVDGGHSHKVTLTRDQLVSINSGNTVVVTSTTDLDTISNQNHSHMYMLSKTTGTTGGGGDPPTGW